MREKAPVGLSIVEKRIPSGAKYEPLRRAILRLCRTARLRADENAPPCRKHPAAPPHRALLALFLAVNTLRLRRTALAPF